MYNPEELKKRYKRISNSALNAFEAGAKYFKKYIDRLLEEDLQKYFELGTKLHMSLLEPEEFKKSYTYLDFTKPRGKQQQEFCEFVVNSKLKDYKDKTINAYNLTYITKGKSNEKIEQEALKLSQSLNTYIKYLETRKSVKDILSKGDVNYLKEAKQATKKHIKANELVFNEDSFIDDSSIFTANELSIYWEHPKVFLNGSKMVLKSIIDRLIIDHEKKIIKLVDLKTSSSLHTFNESYDKYNYHRQMAFYWAGIHYYFKHNFKDKDIKDYLKETYIVAYQTPNHFGKDYPIRCEVIPISKESLSKGWEEIEKLLIDILWHFEENKWEHSRSYYENNGLESIL